MFLKVLRLDAWALTLAPRANALRVAFLPFSDADANPAPNPFFKHSAGVPKVLPLGTGLFVPQYVGIYIHQVNDSLILSLFDITVMTDSFDSTIN
jgi:hypothetical protein